MRPCLVSKGAFCSLSWYSVWIPSACVTQLMLTDSYMSPRAHLIWFILLLRLELFSLSNRTETLCLWGGGCILYQVSEQSAAKPKIMWVLLRLQFIYRGAIAEVQAKNQLHSHFSKVINPPKLNFHALTLQSLLFRARKPDEYTINHLHRSTLPRLRSLRIISVPTESVPPNKAFQIAASLLSPFRSQLLFFFFQFYDCCDSVATTPHALLPFAHTTQCWPAKIRHQLRVIGHIKGPRRPTSPRLASSRLASQRRTRLSIHVAIDGTLLTSCSDTPLHLANVCSLCTRESPCRHSSTRVQTKWAWSAHKRTLAYKHRSQLKVRRRI